MTQNRSTKRLDYGPRHNPIPEWEMIVHKAHNLLDSDSRGLGRDLAIVILSLDIELDKLRKEQEDAKS